MKTSVIRKVTFHSAHRLYNPKWDDKKNDAVFGLCNNPNYHGHNYELHVKVSGEIDPETGFVIDLKVLNDLLQEEIVERQADKADRAPQQQAGAGAYVSPHEQGGA